jgi:hypothetical protein
MYRYTEIINRSERVDFKYNFSTASIKYGLFVWKQPIFPYVLEIKNCGNMN